VRNLGGGEVLAIGPATAAALDKRGIQVAAIPEEFRAEGVIRVLGRRSLRDARVLIPRATVARDLLVRKLRLRGALVDVVPVYRTIASREGFREVVAALRSGAVDLITFTASSTVEFFTRKFRSPADRRRLRAVPAAVIGPITAMTARRHGFRIAIRPAEYTIPALSESIVRRLGKDPTRNRP
jgi:uroporphyrinogen III methyltransferase/synthase